MKAEIKEIIDEHIVEQQIAKKTVLSLLEEVDSTDIEKDKYRAVSRFISGFITDLQNLKWFVDGLK